MTPTNTMGAVAEMFRQWLREGPPDEVLSSPEFYDTFHLRMGKERGISDAKP